MSDKPLLIAHRGACGYLPEHTLEAKAMAYAMGADFLEQDVVATRDDRLVVLHDIHIDSVTNVVEQFPSRARADGRYYARDFDLAELKRLNVHERRATDGISAVYPGRFPTNTGRFSVSTLEEEIELVQGLNRSTGENVGIYPEVKSPAWHHAEGIDVSRQLLRVLANYGYTEPTDPIFVQCFDYDELQRIREQHGCKLRLLQLIAEDSWNESNNNYADMRTSAGLKKVSGVADGIGPWVEHLYACQAIDGQPVSSGLVNVAHENGLQVHPYTFRTDELGTGFDNYAEMVNWFVDELAIDGLFTDFPDVTRRLLE